MRLQSLSVSNLRIIKNTEFVPGEKINLVIGANGSGKTSLLESIYFLSRTRSFRSNRFSDVVRKGEEVLSVDARLLSDSDIQSRLSVRRSKDRLKVERNGQSLAKATELLKSLPVGLMLPSMTGLLESGPRERRRLLDWLLFHVEPDFMSVWQAYHKSMRHRTAALRRDESTVGIWEQQMGDCAERLSNMRSRRMNLVKEEFLSLLHGLLDEDIEISYKAGWEAENGLASILSQRRKEDFKLGYAGVGPHRMDLTMRVEGGLASRRLSRGQMKLAIVALVASFVRCLTHIKSESPIFLLDDFGAELDAQHASKLASVLSRLDCQCVVTSTDERHKNHWDASDMQAFHVEHGEIVQYG